MTNDLLERGEETQAPAPEAENIPENPQETTGIPEGPAPAESAPEEEKSVFAPPVWKRRAAGQEDAAARRAEREAERQEQAADRESRKLELKLAREQRKAQEEERRQERKRQDEERRQEQKRRDEELRQTRREEKAKQKTVRRVGTMTLGVSLILLGLAILLYMVNPSFDLRIVSYLAPVILIALGAEVLIRYFFSKDRAYRYDFASGLICILLVAGSFCVALVPYVMYYIGPERFISEERLIQAEKEKLYQAFQGDQRVQDFYLNGSTNHHSAAIRKGPDGQYLYELDYLSTRIQLLDSCASEEEFAGICRELLDKMMAQDVYMENLHIEFNAPENEEGVRYELVVNNRLILEMDVANLAKLVDSVYSVPTRENGWYPAGYENILNAWGPEYAERFSDLMENYGADEADVYYRLLMEGDYSGDVADHYYMAVTGAAPAPEEQEEPEESEALDGSGESGPEGQDASEGEDLGEVPDSAEGETPAEAPAA